MPKVDLENSQAIPNPEMIDEDNPEWTNEDFALAVPFSSLPQDLQDLLSQPETTHPETDKDSPRHSAA